MKLLKTLMTGLAALSIVSVASAQTTLYITGSTAYRTNTMKAIRAIMTVTDEAYNGTNSNSATTSVITGTLSSTGAAITVKTSWSGSAAGIQTVAGGFSVKFLANIGTGTVVSGGSNVDATTLTSGNASLDEHVPQFAMSDVYQEATPFLGTLTVSGVGTTYPALVQAADAVAIIQFQWVARGVPAGMTNMTTQLARALYSNGTLEAWHWDGVSTNSSATVYAMGRNADSGTRITAFAESGVGALATVKQYAPYATGQSGQNYLLAGGGTIDHLTLWPAETVVGIPFISGNSGYASGGKLAAAMTNNPPNGNTCMISYFGVSDAATITNGTVLKYNGVSYDGTSDVTATGDVKIEYGQYTFWSYEHLYYPSSTSGVAADFVSDLSGNGGSGIPSISGNFLNSMVVGRLFDGSTVF